MRIGIVDYGMGNLASVSRALDLLGHESFIVTAPDQIDTTSRLVLPGVGAFGEAMTRLSARGWIDALHAFVARDRTRLLGICLGMQLLSDRGFEHGDTPGLGYIGGRIRNLRDLGVTERVPHVGWNSAHLRRASPVLDGIPDGTDFYFVHSFGFEVDDPADLVATTPYGIDVTAIVRRGAVWGTQFHPEKSSKAGLRLLKNFVEAA